MISDIKGLHHVTSFAGDAQANNRFHTKVLGLRRVKKTVNFDAPDVYHLYYGDAVGTPGSVMTYFPFPNIGARRKGTGEVGVTEFSVPMGSLDFWRERLVGHGVDGLVEAARFGAKRLLFDGVDGDEFALTEVADDARAPWTGNGVDTDHAIRGFHCVTLRLRDAGPTAELLQHMGYREFGQDGGWRRFVVADGNGAQRIDIETRADLAPAQAGSGSVHHIAFAVADQPSQLRVRKALAEFHQQVTPVIDRDYFFSIYFKTTSGVLFEVATAGPGFTRDEDRAHLGEGLKLPAQHSHLRSVLEQRLTPIED